VPFEGRDLGGDGGNPMWRVGSDYQPRHRVDLRWITHQEEHIVIRHDAELVSIASLSFTGSSQLLAQTSNPADPRLDSETVESRKSQLPPFLLQSLFCPGNHLAIIPK
jgi:hypothetical protein